MTESKEMEKAGKEKGRMIKVQESERFLECKW